MVQIEISQGGDKMKPEAEVTYFWFRRDLRLNDNRGLYHALKDHGNVQPVFIFDPQILNQLQSRSDRRVQFIHETLQRLNAELKSWGSKLQVFFGAPEEVWRQIIETRRPKAVYINHDYEPYARMRDEKIHGLCRQFGIEFKSFKDQVIFERSEILNLSGKPYTVYTPYKKKWLEHLKSSDFAELDLSELSHRFLPRGDSDPSILSLGDIGFESTNIVFPRMEVNSTLLKNYADQRNFPFLDSGTSRLGLHLRFGTLSVRSLVAKSFSQSEVWLSELIWREFFMQILWHFPHVVKSSFKPQYDRIEWRNSDEDFKAWCEGRTGYPLVDAGMRELNATGHMHNRVRMVVASFLCKHLLLDWKRGERYFAQHLLDYDLSANNGNWQWAAGTGCDAAPYFRVFNPETQATKFDAQQIYQKKWVPELGSFRYKPIVEHKLARIRCLAAYKKALGTTEIPES